MAAIIINPSGQSVTLNPSGSSIGLYDEYGFMADRYFERLSGLSNGDAIAVRELSSAWDSSIRDKITAAYPLLGSSVAEKTFNMLNPGLAGDSCRASTLNCNNHAYGVTVPQGSALQGWFNTNIPIYNIVKQFENGVTFYIKDNVAGAGDWLIAGLKRDLAGLSNRWAYHPTSGGNNTDYLCIMSTGVTPAPSVYATGLMSIWSKVEDESFTLYIRSEGVTHSFVAAGDFYQDYLYIDLWATLAFISRVNAAYTLRFAVHFQDLTESEVINKIEKPTLRFLAKTGKL